jgi:hypothetical protein
LNSPVLLGTAHHVAGVIAAARGDHARAGVALQTALAYVKSAGLAESQAQISAELQRLGSPTRAASLIRRPGRSPYSR